MQNRFPEPWQSAHVIFSQLAQIRDGTPDSMAGKSSLDRCSRRNRLGLPNRHSSVFLCGMVLWFRSWENLHKKMDNPADNQNRQDHGNRDYEDKSKSAGQNLQNCIHLSPMLSAAGRFDPA